MHFGSVEILFFEYILNWIDILLRLKTQESRALGVSGLQPCFCHFTGVRLTQPSWSAADWRCQTAVTPILGVSDSHLLFCQQGVVDTSTDSELPLACSTNRHKANVSAFVFTVSVFRILSH